MVLFQLEQFSINDNYELVEVSQFVDREPTLADLVEHHTASTSSEHAQKIGDATTSKNGFLDALPFDVGLNMKDGERRAKENLPLPYMAAQTQKGWSKLG